MEQAQPETKSDGDGRFSLKLNSGDHRLSILADGFAPYALSASVEANGEQDLGQLRLSPGVTLAGRVIDGDGNGIPGAELIREPDEADGLTVLGGSNEVVTRTDAGGGFVVKQQAAGAYKFFVMHDEHPMGELEGVTGSPGETVSGLEVVLGDGVSVRGMVTGMPSDAKSLMATAGLVRPESPDFSFEVALGSKREAEVQPDGSFVLQGLMPNREYSVLISSGKSRLWGSIGRRSQSVSVKTSAEGFGPTVQVPYSRGATVSFQVTDSDGTATLPDSISAGFALSLIHI